VTDVKVEAPTEEDAQRFLDEHGDKSLDEMYELLVQQMLDNPDSKKGLMEGMRKAGYPVDEMEIFDDVRGH
jgi:hypothetical protein